MCKVIPYEAVHAYIILENNVREYDLQLSKIAEWDMWPSRFAQSGPAFTLIHEGKVIGCGGVVLQDWKRGEAWMLLGAGFEKFTLSLCRAVKDKLAEIVKKHNLKRVQATVNPTHTAGQKFLQFFGFQEEGLLRHYGPEGSDYLMYARIY
jgi:RimJ/RimL family protein N-acetyltransferase